MSDKTVFCAGKTKAAAYAELLLDKAGWQVFHHPDPTVRRVLLDVPSFGAGRIENPAVFLSSLDKKSTLYGGNFPRSLTEGFRTVDFLKDPFYLAENAAITARCALELSRPLTGSSFQGLPVLILGWGRIGKCLGQFLREQGADVTITARKDSDLAMIQALGSRALSTNLIRSHADAFRLIFNTIPAPILSEKDSAGFDACIKIDLASERGMEGPDVIWARGLPGKYAPEHSGALIAETFLRLVQEESE